MMDRDFDTCYTKVNELIEGKMFDESNWLDLVTIVMEVVEEIDTLSGPEKKQLAMKIIEDVLSKHITNEYLMNFIRVSVSSAIDKIVDAVNNKFNINTGKISKIIKKIVDTLKSCSGK